MLTDREQELLAGVALVRLEDEEEGRERWLCPDDDAFADAARLWEAGGLDRRWHGTDLVYRASDAALEALSLHRLIEDFQTPN